MAGAAVLGASMFKASVASAQAGSATPLAFFTVKRDAIEFTHAQACRSGAEMLPQTWRKSFMNNRLLVALPLAAVLAFPAIAQTTSSTTDQTQPAATQQTQSTRQTAERAPASSLWHPPSREGFWGRVNPFARKKYVQRQTEPIRDRVNELDELTATNGKAIKDTDSRAQAGIKLASDKANEADQHAIDAGNKATTAQQTAQQATTRVQTR